MKREIFKAKRTDTGEWVKGYYCKKKSGYYDMGVFHESYKDCIIVLFSDGGIIWHEVDPSTICPYTGLTDRNGKEIWENDIVRRTDLHNVKEPSVGFIEYDMENTAFLIHWIDVVNYSATYPWKERIEVIGNIFDNPELLEAVWNMMDREDVKKVLQNLQTRPFIDW